VFVRDNRHKISPELYEQYKRLRNFFMTVKILLRTAAITVSMKQPATGPSKRPDDR